MPENEVRVRFTAQDNVSKQAGRISQTVKGALLGIGAAAGFAATAIATDFVGSLTTGAIGAASDFEESLNKARVVFGDAADEVEDFADSAARSIGTASDQALEMTSTLGNLLNATGVTGDQAAEMSTTMVTLAADFASFNNLAGGTEEALLAIRSGLVGEAEPLRRLGVLLSAARVEAKAMELGLAESTKELTEQDKVLARYHLILQDSTQAQGDFARTSDSFANSQRILSAEFRQLQIEVGQELLPVAQKFIKVLRDDGIPALRFTIEVIKEVVDAVEPLFTTLKGLIEFIVGVFSGDWSKAWNGVKEVFRGAVNFLIDGVNRMIDTFNLFGGALEDVADFFGIHVDTTIDHIGRWERETQEAAAGVGQAMLAAATDSEEALGRINRATLAMEFTPLLAGADQLRSETMQVGTDISGFIQEQIAFIDALGSSVGRERINIEDYFDTIRTGAGGASGAVASLDAEVRDLTANFQEPLIRENWQIWRTAQEAIRGQSAAVVDLNALIHQQGDEVQRVMELEAARAAAEMARNRARAVGAEQAGGPSLAQRLIMEDRSRIAGVFRGGEQIAGRGGGDLSLEELVGRNVFNGSVTVNVNGSDPGMTMAAGEL